MRQRTKCFNVSVMSHTVIHKTPLRKTCEDHKNFPVCPSLLVYFFKKSIWCSQKQAVQRIRKYKMLCLISKKGGTSKVLTDLNAKLKLMNQELRDLTHALRNNINVYLLNRPETICNTYKTQCNLCLFNPSDNIRPCTWQHKANTEWKSRLRGSNQLTPLNFHFLISH